MSIKKMAKAELALLLNTNKDIESLDFWDNESEDIIYWDDSKDVCITEAESARYQLNEVTLVYVTDLMTYVIIQA